MDFHWTALVSLVLGLSAARVSGVFLTFSDFVMGALGEAEPAHGADVMQRINKTVMRSEILATFMALAPASLVAAGFALLRLEGLARHMLVGAGAVYLVAVFAATMARNVPMNDKLAARPYDAPETANYWPAYLRDWTRWNTVRAVGSLVTAAMYLVAALALA